MNGNGSRRPATKAELVRVRVELSIARESLGLLENKRDVLIARGIELLRDSARLRRGLAERWAEIEKLWVECLGREGMERLRSLSAGQQPGFDLHGREKPWMSVRLTQLSLEQYRPAPLGALFDCGLLPDQVRGLLASLLPDLLGLMSVETNIRRIASALRRCQHQVNALDYVILPNLEKERLQIGRCLEEKEREALFQIKRMKAAGG